MRTFVLMTAFLSLFARLFGGEPGKSPYNTADVFDGLRKQILELKTEQLGAPSNQAVLAVLMETGYAEAVASLVAVMDGSTSIYFSNGGGFIGAEVHPGPNAAARALVAKAAEFRHACTRTLEFPLPRRSFTRFYIITPNEVLTTEAKENDLADNRHPMSQLYNTAHALITQIRLANAR